MTRVWLSGIPITVESDTWFTPHRFTWRAETHQVRAIAKRWRVDQEWWQTRIWREYFKLTTHSGLMVVIYYDLINKAWYLQRLYD